MTSLMEQQIRANEYQNQLFAELADLSYRAFGGERQPARGFAPNIVELGKLAFEDNQATDYITKEMIKDYQEQEQRPAGRDVFGNELKYNPHTEDYHLEAFTPIIYPPLGRAATEEDKAEIKRYMSFLADQIQNDRVILDDAYQQQGTIRGILATEEGWMNKTKLYTKLKFLEIEIRNRNDSLKTNTKEFEKLQKQIELIDKNIEENKVKEAEVRTINKKRVKMVEESLMMANRSNNLRVEQGLDESDKDYLARIRQIPNERFDTVLYKDKAELNNIKKFKDYLKELVRRNDIIEDVVKYYPPQTIFQILKIFELVKHKFLKKYGYDNKLIKAQDITDFIDGLLNPAVPLPIATPPTEAAGAAVAPPASVPEFQREESQVVETAAPAPMPATVVAALPVREAVPTKRTRIVQFDNGDSSKFEWGITDNSLYIHNIDSDITNESGRHIFLKIAHVRQPIRNCILFSHKDNGKNNFNEIKGNYFKRTVIDYLGIDRRTAILLFKGNTQLGGYYDLFKSYGLKDIPEAELKKVKGMFNNAPAYGYGLKHSPNEIKKQEIPKFQKLGKITILLHKLFYKNTLSVKDRSLHSIEGLKNAVVSDKFVQIIMNLIDDKPIQKEAINSLNTREKQLYNQVLYLSGLHTNYENSGHEIIRILKRRLELIEGEIEAGNTNKALIIDLRDVLMKLFHYGVISLVSAKKYLSQFK